MSMYELSYIDTLKEISDQGGDRAHLITRLSHVLRNHDMYTDGHNHRVGEVARSIAEALALPSHVVQQIQDAGSLHDIGKLEVPTSYIRKSGALSAGEYDQIKLHPELGAKILYRFPVLLNLIEGVLYHHERFDGLGYPFGLCGEEIPLSARIIALADTFDAMTSERSYRKAMGTDEALEELMRCSGSQFDPRLVEVMTSLRRDLDRIPHFQRIVSA